MQDIYFETICPDDWNPIFNPSFLCLKFTVFVNNNSTININKGGFVMDDNYKVAQLTEDHLQKVTDLESKLGTVLIAYKKTDKKERV